MLEAHYDAYANARELVAGLILGAPDGEAFSAYNAALLELDDLHEHTDIPRIEATTGLARTALHDAAISAVEALPDHGVDRLTTQLIVTRLDAGWAAEDQAQPSDSLV